MRTEVHGDAGATQGGGRGVEGRRLGAVTRVHRVAAAGEEEGCGNAALAEADDGDLARAFDERVGHQRSFSVLSARKAQSTPRIQKRTTTCDSGHPFISK